MIRYQIGSRLPASHYFDVSIHIENPDPAGQGLRLPNWIPGSYMIRDFGRNLLDLHAEGAAGELAIDQVDKSNWRIEPCEGAITISYRVYARDLSVRTPRRGSSRRTDMGRPVLRWRSRGPSRALPLAARTPCWRSR